jgi:hypothetical protein
MKDFGDTIPGHGGVTDRFDCQVRSWGRGVPVQHNSASRTQHNSPDLTLPSRPHAYARAQMHLVPLPTPSLPPAIDVCPPLILLIRSPAPLDRLPTIQLQILMAVFAYTYYFSYISKPEVTLGDVLSAAIKLNEHDQVRLGTWDYRARGTAYRTLCLTNRTVKRRTHKMLRSQASARPSKVAPEGPKAGPTWSDVALFTSCSLTTNTPSQPVLHQSNLPTSAWAVAACRRVTWPLMLHACCIFINRAPGPAAGEAHEPACRTGPPSKQLRGRITKALRRAIHLGGARPLIRWSGDPRSRSGASGGSRSVA